MRTLAICRTYNELHQALRARVDELNIAAETLDDIAGLAERHSSKILAPAKPKRLGPVSFSMLPALGLALVVVEDIEALDRVRSRLLPRKVRRSLALRAT